MAKQTIEVIKCTVHQLHDKLSIVVISKATDDNLEDHVLAVPGPVDKAGDHLHLIEQKNLLGRNPKQKFLLRQRTTTYMARDITATFDIMMAVMRQETADDKQDKAPTLTLVR